MACLTALFAVGGLTTAKSAPDFRQRSSADGCIHPEGPTPDELIAACSKVLSSHILNRNGTTLALTNLAVAYEQKNDWNSALDVLTAAIKFEETWPAFIDRAHAYSQLGKPDLAHADLDNAVKRGSDQPVTYRARGEFYLEQQNFREAAEDFTRALVLNSKDAKSLFYRSAARKGLGDTAGATADLATAKQIDPQVEDHLGTTTRANSYVTTQ